MGYPTLQQYNEALQHPQLALVDSTLKGGSVATTGLGLPLALCGGFALTYTVSARGGKYAVRCFHKQSSGLEQRYSAISRCLSELRSPYFLDFEFQPQGVRINGSAYPVVKMAWASGTTLGQFLESNYRSKPALQQVRAALGNLATYLEGKRVAHGDVQPGNVMVADGGKSIQLIDYDGMFVEAIAGLGSAELGHRNFQHPGRSASSWNLNLDRFAFITLDLALRALEAHPELWTKYQCDGDSVVFKANDLADPSQSPAFAELFKSPLLATDAKNFAAICGAPFEKIPTLADFLGRRNIPVPRAPRVKSTTASRYLSAFPVLRATDYAVCLSHVGDRVELIGAVIEVKGAIARNGKPYVFVNFGPWRGEIVKISIWSEGLASLTRPPDKSWEGKWLSVVGLLEPPFRSPKYGYSHLAVSITEASQLHVISQPEAKFRLSGAGASSAGIPQPGDNRGILDGMHGTVRGRPRQTPKPGPAGTQNQAILAAMQGKQPRPQPGPGRVVQPLGRPVPAAGSRTGCLIVAIGVLALLVCLSLVAL
jgi:hypothetical protein